MSTGGPVRAVRRGPEAARVAAEQAARRRREQKILLAAVVALVVLVVGGGMGLQAWRSGRAPSTGPVPAVADVPQTVADGQPLRFGPAAAPATVTLYEDYHCPHCADFEEEFGDVLSRAQTTGQARVDLYPMSFIDAGSAAAANAAACAAEAGFGQAYHLGLFANPTLEWSDRQLVDLAGEVGGQPGGAFSTCVTTRAKSSWVTSVNTAADANGVEGTPTLFLDGAPVPVEGLTPEKLQTMIETATPGNG